MRPGFEPLFPYELIEVLNGILALALFWMVAFLVMHLLNAWKVIRRKSGIAKSVRIIHRDYKPEIALFTIVSAFCVRTFVLWYVRWLKNNNIQWNDFITNNSGEILITLTAVVILGVVCWIRVISPYTGRRAASMWFLMVTTSVAFGVGMHYFF